MVSFSNLPYSNALKEYKRQNTVLDKILTMPDIKNKWESEYFEEIAGMLFNEGEWWAVNSGQWAVCNIGEYRFEMKS